MFLKAGIALLTRRSGKPGRLLKAASRGRWYRKAGPLPSWPINRCEGSVGPPGRREGRSSVAIISNTHFAPTRSFDAIAHSAITVK